MVRFFLYEHSLRKEIIAIALIRAQIETSKNPKPFFYFFLKGVPTKIPFVHKHHFETDLFPFMKNLRGLFFQGPA